MKCVHSTFYYAARVNTTEHTVVKLEQIKNEQDSIPNQEGMWCNYVYMLEPSLLSCWGFSIPSPGGTTTSPSTPVKPSVSDSEQNLVASALLKETTSNSIQHHLTPPTLLGGPTLSNGETLSCTSNGVHILPDSKQPFSTPNDPPLAESKLE